MLALVPCGGRSVEVNTLGCGPGGEGSIPSAHPIFSFQPSIRLTLVQRFCCSVSNYRSA